MATKPQKMTPQEKEIITSTRKFALQNKQHFDESTKNMILNAVREVNKINDFYRFWNGAKFTCKVILAKPAPKKNKKKQTKVC